MAMMSLREAETLARRQAVALWPDFSSVVPTVAPRQRQEAVVQPLAVAPAEEYVFTFMGEDQTAEGYRLPRVARVTVNMRDGVIKTSASR